METEEEAHVQLPEHKVQHYGIVIDVAERRNWKRKYQYYGLYSQNYFKQVFWTRIDLGL